MHIVVCPSPYGDMREEVRFANPDTEIAYTYLGETFLLTRQSSASHHGIPVVVDSHYEPIGGTTLYDCPEGTASGDQLHMLAVEAAKTLLASGWTEEEEMA